MNTIRCSPNNRSQISRDGVDVQVYPFLKLGARRGVWSTLRLGFYTKEKKAVHKGQSQRVRKISPPLGFCPRAVQPVASRYTDWAILTHQYINLVF
jgi:hypothetical protein